MTRSVIGVELSHTTKIGPASATYASQASCPGDCPLRKNGCYGESGRVGIHTAKLNKSDDGPIEIAYAEAAAIDKLSGLLDLRVHVDALRMPGLTHTHGRQSSVLPGVS